jgi:hypothetical protein
MARAISGAVLGAALFFSSAAHAQEPPPAPPSSTPYLASGGVLLGIGVANGATAPLCLTGAVHENHRTACLATSFAFAGAFTAASIPLLVVGARRRSAPAVVPLPGGVALTWVASW